MPLHQFWVLALWSIQVATLLTHRLTVHSLRFCLTSQSPGCLFLTSLVRWTVTGPCHNLAKSLALAAPARADRALQSVPGQGLPVTLNCQWLSDNLLEAGLSPEPTWMQELSDGTGTTQAAPGPLQHAGAAGCAAGPVQDVRHQPAGNALHECWHCWAYIYLVGTNTVTNVFTLIA